MIKLTKNEKKVLKVLMNNARISDSEIASQLSISSQAVGKIRRKLETSLIDRYTVHINYEKLGIRTFAIAICKLTGAGMQKGQLEVEQILQNAEHIIDVYRLPRGSATHLIVYGFSDIIEMDQFFHSNALKEGLHNYLEASELFTLSHISLIKNSPQQLIHKMIDKARTSKGKITFDQLEQFKKQWE